MVITCRDAALRYLSLGTHRTGIAVGWALDPDPDPDLRLNI